MPASAARVVSSGSRLDRLDDAANGQNPVERRRLRRHALADRVEGGDHLGEHVLVDADTSGAGVVLGDQAGLDVAARQAGRDALAGGQLDVLEAGGQAQADIEALAVDAAHLPGPAIGLAGAVGAGKSGHAAERHRRPLSPPESFGRLAPSARI